MRLRPEPLLLSREDRHSSFQSQVFYFTIGIWATKFRMLVFFQRPPLAPHKDFLSRTDHFCSAHKPTVVNIARDISVDDDISGLRSLHSFVNVSSKNIID